MKTELEIKEILKGGGDAKNKADSILKFMDWDRGRLIDAIEKHGTSSKEGRDDIIRRFWGSAKR